MTSTVAFRHATFDFEPHKRVCGWPQFCSTQLSTWSTVSAKRSAVRAVRNFRKTRKKEGQIVQICLFPEFVSIAILSTYLLHEFPEWEHSSTFKAIEEFLRTLNRYDVNTLWLSFNKRSVIRSKNKNYRQKGFGLSCYFREVCSCRKVIKAAEVWERAALIKGSQWGWALAVKKKSINRKRIIKKKMPRKCQELFVCFRLKALHSYKRIPFFHPGMFLLRPYI